MLTTINGGLDCGVLELVAEVSKGLELHLGDENTFVD